MLNKQFMDYVIISMLVARQGDVSRKLNQAFLLVDSFNFNFVDDDGSDICNNLIFMAIIHSFFEDVKNIYNIGKDVHFTK